jgi:acyl carrier protein
MQEQLLALIAEMLDLPANDVRLDMRREQTDEWDSMNHLRLVTAIESECGVSFSMDEIVELQTPGDILRIIQARGGSASGD